MQDCDFIPADYHRARALGRDIKVRVACVSLMIIIMILWVVTHEHQLAQVNAMVDDVARQHEQIAIHLTKKTSMETEQAKLRAHGRLIRVLEDHSSLVVVFSDVSRRMPDSIVLTEVSANCPSLARYAAPEEPAVKPMGQRLDSRHENRTAQGDCVGYESVGVEGLPDRLFEVDDVDSVTRRKDKRAHLGVPPSGLMPKVNSRFEQILHNNFRCHATTSLV